MRRYTLVFLTALTLFFVRFQTATAGTPAPFGRTATPGGKFSLGLQPALYFDPNEFYFFGNLGYGITKSIALDGRVGFSGSGSNDVYLGGNLRFELYQSRTLNLDLIAGAHAFTSSNAGAFDAALVFGTTLGEVGLMLAADVDIFLGNASGASPAFNLDAGIDFAVSRNLLFIVTGEFGVTNTASSGISGGLMFYL